VVEFKNVSLILGDKQILKDLSFKIEEGKIILLSGNSGEGKSTILKLILGLIKPTSGSITVLGQNIGRLSTKELMNIRQQCGIVFQEGALFDSLSVEENVSFFLKEALHIAPDKARHRVLEILEHLSLKEYLDYYPAQLSGGMKKRVAIARAIVTHPRLLLYDEPTAGLDARSASRVVGLIKDLQQRLNVTSLIVSHELYYFARVMDKMIHLEQGRITSEQENNAELLALSKKNFLGHFIQE